MVANKHNSTETRQNTCSVENAKVSFFVDVQNKYIFIYYSQLNVC